MLIVNMLIDINLRDSMLSGIMLCVIWVMCCSFVRHYADIMLNVIIESVVMLYTLC